IAGVPPLQVKRSRRLFDFVRIFSHAPIMAAHPARIQAENFGCVRLSRVIRRQPNSASSPPL
ncbi:hypothetical protein QC402_RS27770, partial [Escherichia coli]